MEHPSPDRSRLRGPSLRISVMDHTGNRLRMADLVANIPISDLTQALVTGLGLPVNDPSSRRVAYHLYSGSRQLTDNETLLTAGLRDGSEIVLLPEPVAGGRLS